ncbi:peptidoglycan editing factor PgeF [Hyphomicrobium sp. CS1BSMeth3]|uniref:peptidoglycan editing factor PgeF n=1 Tax=Hyphomicrobium sp. CS1BSMeth3 TaxID=1892844 RepID=UPI0009317859|nr:peptidoglycan editing factor PgeF [Hyphomicrobium sp. CS1BSMeth3]
MLQPIQSEALGARGRIAHGFFGRQGGVSEGIYAALNCGLGSKDARDMVGENRRRVAQHLGVAPAHLLTAHQHHSADAVVVTEPWTFDTMPKADALVTATPGIALGALAADCAPVLFADAEAGVVAAAHAGWKGALHGVLESAVATMERLGARRARIAAVLGPCIGPTAYEVGPEFEANFIAQSSEYKRFFERPSAGARPYFDLPAFVLHRLGAMGLGAVESQTRCTYGHSDDFFSYRRTTHRREPDYGRQISAIVLL